MTRWFGLVILGIAAIGCSSGPKTQLSLSGDPRGTAQYNFRDVYWRAAGETGGTPELVGYGLIPYENSYMSPNWQPGIGPSGFATMYLRGQPDGNGKYAVMILGPLSPGTGEVLTSVAQNVVVEQPDSQTRVIQFNDVPTTARNKPDMSFRLSGTIVAKSTSAGEFERNLNEFATQLRWRMSAPPR